MLTILFLTSCWTSAVFSIPKKGQPGQSSSNVFGPVIRRDFAWSTAFETSRGIRKAAVWSAKALAATSAEGRCIGSVKDKEMVRRQGFVVKGEMA